MKNFFVIITSILVLIGCNSKNTSLEDESIVGSQDFKMENELVCETVTSSNPENIGDKFSLSALNDTMPRVIFEVGSQEFNKIYEKLNIIVLQLIASAGGIDTISIDTNTGVFARTSSGVMTGVFAIASKGTCK